MTLFEGNNILSIIEMITTALEQHKINTNITYRLKHPISILDKMITKNVDLHGIKDLIAFRLIVQKLKDCYKVLDIIEQVHSTNKVNKKDYIATPKHNGYRSLHIIISDNEFMRNVEIQVRTKKMHNVAESGSASHYIYKDQKKSKIDSLSHTVLDDLGTEKAYEIWRSFEWTIPELDTYEQELKKVLHHYKAEKVTT